MTQLVPIVLDLLVSPESIAAEVLAWMVEEGAGPRDADERARLQIAAMRACLVVQELARDIGRDMDAHAAREEAP